MTANPEGRGLVAIGRRRTYPHPREGVAWPRHHRQCGGAESHRHSGVLYGALIGADNDPLRLFIGYLIGGGVMIIGGVTELLLGVMAPAWAGPVMVVSH